MILEIIIVLVLLLLLVLVILLKYYNVISYKIFMTFLIILIILNALSLFGFDKLVDFAKLGVWGGVGWLLIDKIFILREKFVIGEKVFNILSCILFIVWIIIGTTLIKLIFKDIIISKTILCCISDII